MTTLVSEFSPKRTARTAGILYLVIFFANMFVFFMVSGALTVPGDAAATAGNIMASESLYRLGIAGYLLVFLSDLGVAVLFYILLRPVNQTLSLVAMVARLIQTAIHGINLLFYIFPLLLLNGADYLTVFSSDQLNAFVLLFSDAHYMGVLISEAFFALSTLVLAYLLYKSSYFPKILGILMLLPSLSYFLDSFGIFLFPQLASTIPDLIIAPTVIGEMSLTLYLLIKGVKDQEATAVSSQAEVASA